MTTESLLCDGCAQQASPEHVARRLQRLEWTTRYRPVHIATLLLGAVSPQNDGEFLYSGKFAGEAGRILEAAGIGIEGKAPEAGLAEFQRGGFFLAYVLECPLEASANEAGAQGLLAQRMGAVLARVRRSLRPKRAVLLDGRLQPFVEKLTSGELQCSVLLDAGKPFAVDGPGAGDGWVRLRTAMGRKEVANVT